jgi:hypothetical protein
MTLLVLLQVHFQPLDWIAPPNSLALLLFAEVWFACYWTSPAVHCLLMLHITSCASPSCCSQGRIITSFLVAPTHVLWGLHCCRVGGGAFWSPGVGAFILLPALLETAVLCHSGGADLAARTQMLQHMLAAAANAEELL